MTPLVVSVIGVTNAGKSTLMDHMRSVDGCACIEIGKEMRRRHPPEYFQGLGAMAETEQEVWEIFDEQHSDALHRGAPLVLIDGQPRLESQVLQLRIRVGKYRLLQLHAPHDELRRRAEARDGASPGALQLTERRLVNDYRQLYEVLTTYNQHIGLRPVVVNTAAHWLLLTRILLLNMLERHYNPKTRRDA